MKQLAFGKTPWDHLSREELLREVQRAYAAVQSARSVLSLSKAPEPHSLFWTKGGSGFRALAMCDRVVEDVESKFDSESVYRSFFRYAVDLLFSPELGFGWRVCEKGHMVGSDDRPIKAACDYLECGSPTRWISWKDIEASK